MSGWLEGEGEGEGFLGVPPFWKRRSCCCFGDEVIRPRGCHTHTKKREKLRRENGKERGGGRGRGGGGGGGGVWEGDDSSPNQTFFLFRLQNVHFIISSVSLVAQESEGQILFLLEC